jgi:Rrf2 family protein
MKISTKGEYGIRAMLYIAMCGEGSGSGGGERDETGADRAQPVTSHEIAEHQSIPEPYLRQILAQLARDRLVQSARGPQGGHLLGRPAAEISLRDILISLEGQTTSVDQILSLPCQIEVGPQHCAIREALLEVKQAVETILERITLADLLARQQRLSSEKIVVPLDLAPGRLPVLRG